VRAKLAVAGRDRAEDAKKLESLLNKLAPPTIHKTALAILELAPEPDTVEAVTFQHVIRGAQMPAVLIACIKGGADPTVFLRHVARAAEEFTRPLAPVNIADRHLEEPDPERRAGLVNADMDAFKEYRAQVTKRKCLAQWICCLQSIGLIEDMTEYVRDLVGFVTANWAATDEDTVTVVRSVTECLKAMNTAHNHRALAALLPPFPKDVPINNQIKWALQDVREKVDYSLENKLLIAQLFYAVAEPSAGAPRLAEQLANNYRNSDRTEQGAVRFFVDPLRRAVNPALEQAHRERLNMYLAGMK
jgi:hypothetical protein